MSGTPVHPSNMIARRFRNKLQRGNQYRENNPQEQINHIPLESSVSQILLSRIRVRCIRQESTNTDRRSRNANCENILETSIDVAIHFPVPPVRRVRIRPYNRVEKVEQVEQENPPDKNQRRPWTRRDFPVEIRGRNTEEKSNARENGEGNVGHVLQSGWS